MTGHEKEKKEHTLVLQFAVDCGQASWCTQITRVVVGLLNRNRYGCLGSSFNIYV
jgi:hypothetical protein